MHRTYLTESELIERYKYCTYELDSLLALEDSIDSVAESLPFMAHINKKATLEIEYLNSISDNIVGYTPEEIRNDSLGVFRELLHPSSFEYSRNELMDKCHNLKKDEVFTYVEYIRGRQESDYKGYITFVKSCRYEPENLLALSIPSGLFGDLADRFEKIVEIDRFRLENFQNFQSLTDREKQLLKLLAKGFSSREISDLLNISNHTVKTHRQNLNKKLGIKSFADIMQYAISFDLVVI